MFVENVRDDAFRMEKKLFLLSSLSIHETHEMSCLNLARACLNVVIWARFEVYYV